MSLEQIRTLVDASTDGRRRAQGAPGRAGPPPGRPERSRHLPRTRWSARARHHHLPRLPGPRGRHRRRDPARSPTVGRTFSRAQVTPGGRSWCSDLDHNNVGLKVAPCLGRPPAPVPRIRPPIRPSSPPSSASSRSCRPTPPARRTSRSATPTPSGVGTRSYIDDGTSCQRSNYAYPKLVAAAGYALNWGLLRRHHRHRDERPAQRPDQHHHATSPSPSAATTPVSAACSPSAPSRAGCRTATARSTRRSRSSTTPCPGGSARSTPSIRSGRPTPSWSWSATPRVFMGEDCNAATFFRRPRETRSTPPPTCSTPSCRRRRRQGLQVGEPHLPFTGHAVCDDVEWLNGFSNPSARATTPTASGTLRLPAARRRTARRLTPHRIRRAPLVEPTHAAKLGGHRSARAGDER